MSGAASLSHDTFYQPASPERGNAIYYLVILIVGQVEEKEVHIVGMVSQTKTPATHKNTHFDSHTGLALTNLVPQAGV